MIQAGLELDRVHNRLQFQVPELEGCQEAQSF